MRKMETSWHFQYPLIKDGSLRSFTVLEHSSIPLKAEMPGMFLDQAVTETF